MGENIDEAKGRAKQAAGDLADDEGLKNEGRVDRAVSDVKDKIDDVKEKRKVDELLDDLGRLVYRQRTDRGEPGDEAVIVGLVAELRTLEAEGVEIVAPVSAPAEAPPSTPSPDASFPEPE